MSCNAIECQILSIQMVQQVYFKVNAMIKPIEFEKPISVALVLYSRNDFFCLRMHTMERRRIRIITDLGHIQNRLPQFTPFFFVSRLVHGSLWPSQRGGSRLENIFVHSILVSSGSINFSSAGLVSALSSLSLAWARDFNVILLGGGLSLESRDES